MKILKNFILSLLQTDNLPSDLTYKQRRIIKYTNYGALIVSIIPLLLGIIFFILNPDYFNKNYWTLGISLLYLSIPFINKFQYYELSKIVALLLITVDLVSFNLYIYKEPFYLILPFIVANIFYSKLGQRIIISFSLFILTQALCQLWLPLFLSLELRQRVVTWERV